MKKFWKRVLPIMLSLIVTSIPLSAFADTSSSDIFWKEPVLINNVDFYSYVQPDAKGIKPGTYGSQYARMVELDNGNWLTVYTVYRNNGYLADPNGGNQLELAVSEDKGTTWTIEATISDPGRDLDNGQMIQLSNGDLLLACRSVIWQQSYRLPVYKSTDRGQTWQYFSTIDENEGSAAGSLGNPDRGVYEPYFYMLDQNRLGVMYANEKYAASTPTYSQVISQKISTDNGLTWGNEIWVVNDLQHSNARPGMPVWTQMSNGKFIAVYEIVSTEDVNIFYKISDDGTTWPSGIGTQILNQRGAPYILSMTDGTLLVTSNTHCISRSLDFGQNWSLEPISPYGSLFGDDDNLWPSMYQVASNEIAVLTSVGRSPAGDTQFGHNVQIRKGTLRYQDPQHLSGGCYKLMAKHSGNYLDVSAGSMDDGAAIQQWSEDWLPPQNWYFESAGNGYYKIISAQSGKALTVQNDSDQAGASVIQQDWSGSDGQMWAVEESSDNGYYRIRNKSGGKCLDVAEGKTETGARVQVWNDNGLDPQKWQLEVVDGLDPSGTYSFLAKHSGKALEVANGSTQSGGNVQQWELNHNDWQKWNLQLDASGYYQVINKNSAKCLDVSAGAMEAGANVQQWDMNGMNPQKWQIVNMGKGYFKFVVKHTRQCLDVDAGKQENGANVQQWTDNGEGPQRWKIIVAG